MSQSQTIPNPNGLAPARAEPDPVMLNAAFHRIEDHLLVISGAASLLHVCFDSHVQRGEDGKPLAQSLYLAARCIERAIEDIEKAMGQ